MKIEVLHNTMGEVYIYMDKAQISILWRCMLQYY